MNESANPKHLTMLDIGFPVALMLALGAVFAVDVATREIPAMEIVFILDEAAGLAASTDDMKSRWIDIAQSLVEQEIDCRFAVLPCHADSLEIPVIPLTDDFAEFKRRLTDADSGPDQPVNTWPETDCLRALADVLQFEFREKATPLVFLTTNSIVDDQARIGQLASQYRQRGIKTMIQAHEAEQNSLRPLYQGGGQFYTLAGVNKTERDAERETDDASAVIGNLLSQSSGTGTASGHLPPTEQFIAGVKVIGKIALVCDVSGSMTSDFPPLVGELRDKFPADTPLILVQGCHFAEPSPANQQPIRLSQSRWGRQVLGVDFSNDEHVYFCANTTDAILMAIRRFRRDTVMFNNDLQDSGSLRAIEAFEQLWNRRPFTLSGRSLNCDAPPELKGFIEKSGGDFKVDPINRSVSPARNWRP